MAETSGLWTTAGAPAGDQVVSYTQALSSDMLAIAAGCSGYQGVVPGYLNELIPDTGAAFIVRIGTGGAMVDGKYYKNSAAVDKTLSTPTAGTTRIDRVVIEATWASFECEITVIEGVESGGEPVAPAIPSTPGTNYAIQICQALVNNAGTVTITDERTWAITPTDDTTLEKTAVGSLRVKALGITAAQIASDAVTTAKILDSNVTAVKIANRTRRLWVPAQPDDTSVLNFGVGVLLADGVTDSAFGSFTIPSDFVSTMTIKAVVYPGATGNAYIGMTAIYGAAGEAVDTHSESAAIAAVAVTSGRYSEVTSVSLANAAAGDYVIVAFFRQAGSANDTVNNVFYITGFLVEYTADS